MLTYDVLWCDWPGAGAISSLPMNFVKTHINAENESEMWKLAYLLKTVISCKSASNKNLKSISEMLEEAGFYYDEIDNLLNKNDYSKNDFDNLNLDSRYPYPYIILITLNGKEIYNCGRFLERYNEDW